MKNLRNEAISLEILADVIKNILIARINEELEYMGINAEPSEEFWVYSQE